MFNGVNSVKSGGSKQKSIKSYCLPTTKKSLPTLSYLPHFQQYTKAIQGATPDYKTISGAKVVFFMN